MDKREEILRIIQELDVVSDTISKENFICAYSPDYLGMLVLKAKRALEYLIQPPVWLDKKDR